MLDDSVPVAVSVKDAITAIITFDITICHAVCAVRKLVRLHPIVNIRSSSALRGDRLNSLQLTEVSLYVFTDCALIGRPRARAVVTVVVSLCVQPRPTVVKRCIFTSKTRTSELTVRDVSD